jgi:hypothetical protein
MPAFVICMILLCLIYPPFLGFVGGIAAFFAISWLIAKLLGA